MQKHFQSFILCVRQSFFLKKNFCQIKLCGKNEADFLHQAALLGVVWGDTKNSVA